MLVPSLRQLQCRLTTRSIPAFWALSCFPACRACATGSSGRVWGERGPCAFRDESAEVGTKQQARRSLNSAKPIFAFLWPLGDRVNFFCSKVLQITESEHLNYGAAMLFGNPDLEPKPSKALPCDPPPLVHLLSGLMLFGLMVLSFGGSGLDAYFLVFCRPGSIRTKYFGTRVFNCRPGTLQPPVV